jgi:hypothetical protein
MYFAYGLIWKEVWLSKESRLNVEFQRKNPLFLRHKHRETSLAFILVEFQKDILEQNVYSFVDLYRIEAWLIHAQIIPVQPALAFPSKKLCRETHYNM